MIEILTVCTGNICRSPLAAQLIRTRLAPIEVNAHSAGTRGMNAAEMTPEALQLAAQLGVTAEDSTSHRSRYLTERDLVSPDLILTMTRDHRREVAELAPSRLRSTFAIREFARLAAAVPDAELIEAADSAGPDAAARVRAVAAQVASHRGLVPPPDDPADDDVVDPYRRSWRTYERSAAELEPAVDEVVRVLRLAIPPTP